VSAVLAKSFARIFFRNAINVGLPVLVCDTDKIDTGDDLIIDLSKGIIKDITKDIEITFQPLPPAMVRILFDGGIVEHYKKYDGFKLD